MAIIEATYYEVQCDEPGCTVRTSELGGEFSAYSAASNALQDWIDGDQYHGTRGDFCEDHAPRCEADDCTVPLRGEPGEERFCQDHADDAEVTA